MDMVIGHTGFVGGTWIRQSGATGYMINSKNPEDIEGKEVDHLFCAGIDARKWMANKDPESDLAAIELLMNRLEKTKAKRATLISTIDVYGDPKSGEDEKSDPHPSHAYGANRLFAEKRFAEIFPESRILRLPALFGKGLKKNALRDFLDDQGPEWPLLGAIHPKAVFQWYDMDRLSGDIHIAWESREKILSMVTKPISINSLARVFFPDRAHEAGKRVPKNTNPPVYAMRTMATKIWEDHSSHITKNREPIPDGLIESPTQTRRRLAKFISDEMEVRNRNQQDPEIIMEWIRNGKSPSGHSV